MTQPRLRELVQASNPVLNPDRLLLEEREVLALYTQAMQRAGNPQVSTDLPDSFVERRRDMQTQERPTQFRPEPPAQPRRRWLIPALAAAVIVVLIGVGAVLFNNDGSEVVDPTPTTVVTTTAAPTTTTTLPAPDPAALTAADVLNEAATTADWAAVEAVFAESATIQFISQQGTTDPVSIDNPLAPDAGIVDWNGDGAVTELDWFLTQGAEIYVGRTTTVLVCEPGAGGTAVCDEVREGFVFKSDDHVVKWILTVEDGLITNLAFDVSESTANAADPLQVGRYQRWVGDNRPELEAELFTGFATMTLTPDTLETHRQLVAEWQAEGAGS